MKKDISTILADLSANTSDEDRENSRTRLQQHFQECDSRLRELVKSHRQNLSQSVQSCSKVINTVAESKIRCSNLKDRITSCMNILQCNRENIRRMWLESLQHKYAHKILSEIEELRKIPREVNESLINKKLEHATEVIVSSIKFLDSTDCNVDALKELRSDIYTLQEKLYIMVLEDLRKHLHYTDFLDCFSKCDDDITYDDIFTNKIPKSDYYFKDVLNQIVFDESYINVLLNCVTTMKRLPDAIEFLKENCQTDLETLSFKVSKFMHDIIQNSVDVLVLELPGQKQDVFLLDLMENIIYIFAKVASNYKIFFTVLQNAVEANGLSDIQLQLDDICFKIQAAVEHFAENYFETQSSNLSPKESFVLADSQNVCDIGAFFNPQNPTEENFLNLFKFTNSFQGISYKKYSKGTQIFSNKQDSAETSDKSEKAALICRPALKNIILLFIPLKNFVSEIEQSLDCVNQSPLYAFLYDSANLFLDQVNSDINKKLKTASANLEAWNTSCIGEYSSFGFSSEKQVLSCSIIITSIMKELRNLTNSLPDYSNHFLRLIYYVILDYKDMYHRAFKQMFDEEQNVLSISWARDKDIRRLMKSYLNWRHLEDEKNVDNIESPEEIRLRNYEESELLIRNLRSEDQSSWDIITDNNKLSNLALLQESLIWFSVKLSKFVKVFNQSPPAKHISLDLHSNNTIVENSITNAIIGLRKVNKEYEDFADMCLLALHLEVRARCFHYLLTFSVQEICVESRFIQELDTAVKRLTSDLLQIDEVLRPILSPKEFKYVFEGLGELVASLMILIVSNMHKINETVVLKIDRNIFTIQCCLANITMAREVSLERARQFIDLLKSSHEEILNQIVEEGPRFNKQEYIAVFKLISCSSAEASHGLDYYVEKLLLIFKRLAANAKDVTAVPY